LQEQSDKDWVHSRLSQNCHCTLFPSFGKPEGVSNFSGYTVPNWRRVSERERRAQKDWAEEMQYAFNHESALRRYCEDDRLEIDSNAAERILRLIAIGRKNWLFYGINPLDRAIKGTSKGLLPLETIKNKGYATGLMDSVVLIQRISLPIDGLNQIGNARRFEIGKIRNLHVC